MLNRQFRTIVGSCFAILVVSNANAQRAQILEGCYVPTNGFAETVSYTSSVLASPSAGQLGRARAFLVREGWDSLSANERARIARVLIIEGPIYGKLNDNATPGIPFDDSVDHVIGDKDREGILLTEGDMFIPSGIPEFCDDSFTAFVLNGKETLNVKEGIGRYSGLDTSAINTIVVQGFINLCTGRNDFQVVAGEGQLCFIAPQVN